MSSINTHRLWVYPSAPLTIDGAFLIDITTIGFDNNARQEIDLNTNYDYPHPSQTITFTRWNGKLSITEMIVKNLKGNST